MLQEGRVEEWNAYREEHPDFKPRLTGADLRNRVLTGVNLSEANLSGADLDEADLTRADLSGANLGEADLSGANLSGADLSGANHRAANLRAANLSGADLSEANLHMAYLSKANLDGARLFMAILTGADLSGAGLRDANLRAANLRGASLRGADLGGADLSAADLSAAGLSEARLFMAIFTGADLREASFKRANLHRARFGGPPGQGGLARFGYVGARLDNADFEGADLREARGLRLDNTHIRNAKFSPNVQEPWSILRRKYTGARLFFHLLFLTAFVVPYAARTFLWVGVNRTETVITETVNQLCATAEDLRDEDAPSAETFTRITEELDRARSLSVERWETWSVWQLLLGVDKGASFWILAGLLILYNLCRYLLTSLVGALRDEEERSGYSPEWKRYRWLFWAHQFVAALWYVALVSFAWHGWHWLATPVLLPA